MARRESSAFRLGVGAHIMSVGASRCDLCHEYADTQVLGLQDYYALFGLCELCARMLANAFDEQREIKRHFIKMRLRGILFRHRRIQDERDAAIAEAGALREELARAADDFARLGESLRGTWRGWAQAAARRFRDRLRDIEAAGGSHAP